MGYTTSTVHGIEVPDSSEANDVPEDIGKVVTALEGGSIIRRLTGAQIAALTAPQKPAGLVVYNTTTGKVQVSDGTNFTNVITAPGAWQTPSFLTGYSGVTYRVFGDLVYMRGTLYTPYLSSGAWIVDVITGLPAPATAFHWTGVTTNFEHADFSIGTGGAMSFDRNTITGIKNFRFDGIAYPLT